MQRKVLQDEVLLIVEAASREEVEWLRRHVTMHSMNVNEASAEEILSWVRSIKAFKKIHSNNKNQDVQNMLMAKVN